MKYHGGKIRNAVISLVVVLAIVLGSFYYGSFHHASYGQPEETEVTAESMEDGEAVVATALEETEATVFDSPEILGADNSQEEAVTSGTEDGTQENEAQTGEADETLAETQDGEQQDSAQMQNSAESLKLFKSESVAATESNNREFLAVGKGLTGDISSVVKMRLNDLYLEGKDGTKKYIIQKGGTPENGEQLSELKVGEILHLDYFWDIIYNKDKGINEIQHIKHGNYFQVELPDYKVFNNFEMLSQEVFITKEDSTEPPFKFGEYSIEKIGEKRYLRLTMTEKDEHYQKNIVASVTGGHPQLTFKVRKELGQHTIEIPGVNETVTDNITIKIEENPAPQPAPQPKPNPGGENQGEYEKPGVLVKESHQHKDYGKDRVRWWIHVNRDVAYDMFSDGFDYSATPRKNLVFTDKIEEMTATNPKAKFNLDPSSVIIYLDMLKPIIKNGKVTGFSHGPVFGRWIYKHNSSISGLDKYFDGRVTADNKNLEVRFGDIPNANNTYRKAFGDSEENIKILDDFLKDTVISNPDKYTEQEYWDTVKKYKDKLLNNGKNFTDYMMDRLTRGHMTVNQARIMKKTYWDLNTPIMHYTIQFDTVFRGMKAGDTATNKAYLKSDKVDTTVTQEQKINEVYLEDNPVTRSPKVNIVINKEWQDASGKDMAAPVDDISVQLLQDGQPYGSSVKIGKHNNWKDDTSFKGLPGYKKQNVEYKYSVKELKTDGYDVEIKEVDEGHTITFNIINKKKQGNIHFKIKKVWQNSAGEIISDTSKLPEVEVQVLMKKSTESVFNVVSKFESIKLNHGNNWTYEVTGLDEFDEAGKKIQYKVKEVKVPEGYLASGGDVHDPSTCTFTIINKAIPKIKIQVEKKWVDKDNNILKPNYQKIPDKVEVQVLVNGVVKDTIFVHKNQGWLGEFKELPKLDVDGNVIDYVVKEINVPKGFTVLSTVKDGENKFVITNKKTDEVVKIHITKKWLDLNNQAITDNNLLPDNVSFQLLANGVVKDTIYVYKNANWIYVSENLAKLDDKGAEIVYTIKEVNLPYGYAATVEKGNQGGYEFSFVVTNKQTPPPPSNPFIPPITPPTPTPPPDIVVPNPPTPLTPPDVPSDDITIDDDDVARTDVEEEPEDEDVIDDSIPLVNIPKTGMNNPLVYLIGISVLSLVMIFRLRSKK